MAKRYIPPLLCPECHCPIQRTLTGTLDDGIAAHYRTVHPGLEPPLWDSAGDE